MDLELQNSYNIDNNRFPTDSDGSSDTASNSSMNSHILSKKKAYKYKKINKNINNKLNNINDEHDNDNKKQNIIIKLLNRERTGYFSNSPSKKCKQFAYKKVPTRLSFCLKEIVPYCQYLQGHVFMGLSACGQFLLSYKVSYDEEISNNNYNFSTSQKYELYFWIYRPHMLLVKYYNVCLFDDHGVHNLITVTMSQWMTDPRTLIVHGTNEFDNEDSYLTIVSVPKLGCLDCKALRDEYSDEYLRCDSLCIKCNLTIHTKYSSTESDPKFNPKINLNCPGRIIMISNGFIHMLHVQLDLNKIIKPGSSSFKLSNNDLDKRNINYVTGLVNGCFGLQSPLPTSTPLSMTASTTMTVSTSNTVNNCLLSDDKVNTVLIDDLFSVNKVHIIDNNNQIKIVTRSSHSYHHDKKYSNISSTITNDSQNIKQADNCSIVDRIIADFAECETDNYGHEKIFRYPPRIDRATAINTTKNFDELVITCSGSNNSNSICDETGDLPSSSNPATKSLYNNIQLLKHHNQDSSKGDKVISKSLRTTRNCITTIDLSGNVNNETIPPATSSNSNLDIAAKTYEFSEDNEKCEKISTFRKRRLADKKYEFDEEDNSENIIPFNRLRTMYKNFPFHTKSSRPTSMSPNRNFTNSNNTNPNNLYTASSPNYDLTNHLHRASPSHGFRSPCGSPVGNRCLRSPPGSLNRSSCLYSGRSHTYATMKSSMSPRQLVKKTPATDALLNDQQQQTELLINKSAQPQTTQSPKRTISDEILPILNQSTNNSNSNGNSNNNAAKPVCTKKFVRRFVEEDDATSVITSEEDDCISPGYHTSLPMEVHGACYSDMQMISQASYYKLKNCPTVTITQNSFDLETFTFYIANHLCTIHNKKYGVFYDWACELVQVCPLSNILTCILMIHFTAREHLLLNEKSCMNCANNLDCVLHRKHYQCSTLFTWDTDTGIWNVLDYGLLIEVESGNAPFSSNVKVKRNPIKMLLKNNNLVNAGRQLHDKIKNVANYLTTSYDFNYKFLNNLRVLDSCHEKSKNILHDLHNSIEFYRSHNNDMDMDSSTSNQDDSSDLSYFLPSDIDD